MTIPKLVGLAGSFNRPSKTHSLVDYIACASGAMYGVNSVIYDLTDIGPSLGQAMNRNNLDRRAREILADIVHADVLVVGASTFKGSYPGLFKHLIDFIDPSDLRAKPIILAATGGGTRHALMVGHQLRPLFSFFMAYTLPTAVYASDQDFTDFRVSSKPLSNRIAEVIDELSTFFPIRSESHLRTRVSITKPDIGQY